jgi:acyl-CoA dehydrogenase
MDALNLPRPAWMSEDLVLLEEQARRFLAAELVPHVERWHENGIMDREVWNKLGAAGLLRGNSRGIRRRRRHLRA